MMPLFSLFASFSSSNPIFSELTQIWRLIFPRKNSIVPYTGRLIVGTLSWIGSLILFAGLGMGLLITGIGILCLSGWTKFLNPPNGGKQLRGNMTFGKGIQIYKSLRVLCIIHSEMARDFIQTCIHHAAFVVYSSLIICFLLRHIMAKEPLSLLIIFGACTLIIAAFGAEWFVVYFISSGSSGSKQYIHRMQKYECGTNKYRRKLVTSLLPNWINLEIIGSVDTLRNGIQLNYFLNFVSRVTDFTLRLLFAKNKTDVIG